MWWLYELFAEVQAVQSGALCMAGGHSPTPALSKDSQISREMLYWQSGRLVCSWLELILVPSRYFLNKSQCWLLFMSITFFQWVLYALACDFFVMILCSCADKLQCRKFKDEIITSFVIKIYKILGNSWPWTPWIGPSIKDREMLLPQHSYCIHLLHQHSSALTQFVCKTI